ncbi:hypothetical protein EJ03DRAFT_355526 [Teratosphaeria nubilosa]|uniref:Mediator complex subunit 15 KIX domain-containing protein n=1 Tax=Teratosphaeria nubilosa TaxID=161662 RepID=A0A6G1KVQ5_9PEZI|nr:hypothetical protein EJ03DRAFT_355526 [Teratosphaeria nubilosa]
MGMPNGMMPPNTNGMQRSQQGNAMQQPHARIIEELKKSLPTLPDDWRKIMDLRHRAQSVMQLISALKLLMSNPAEVSKVLQIAITFENNSIKQATSKEHYDQMLQGKLEDVRKKRESQAMQMMPQGHFNMNPNVGMGQHGMPNMNGMGINMQNGGNMMMPNGQMNMNLGGNSGQANSAFPAHLQRQMQPSPRTQQPGAMDPSALQSATSQNHLPNMGQQNPQQGQMTLQQGGQGPQMQNNSQQALMMRARQMYNNMTEENRNTLRQRLNHTLSPQEQELDKQHGRDPLFRMLMKRISQSNRQAMLQQNGGNMQPGNQQTMMGGNVPQQNGGPPNFDFITGQQANALKQQESGELVVPASNNANMGMGNQMNMGAQNGINPQMLAGGSTSNQQPSNPQFQRQISDLMQQQKATQAAQVAHQRNLLAQQQAQQHSNQLRGQPGGLNAPNALNGGPPGQTHSPAMSMLNRPMVPPGQAAPGTPNQQNRPPTQPPQTPGNVAAQNLVQHYQQMTNQGGGQMNQPNQSQASFDPVKRRQELSEITQGMPHQLRQMVISRMMEPMQAKILVQQQRKHAMQQQGMPNGVPNQQAAMPPNMQNMGQAQMGGQPNMFGGALGQGLPGNTVPNFNSQPPANQQAMNQSNMDSVHLQQKMQQQALMARALDMRMYNRTLLTPLNLNVPVPGEVGTWGRLKQWAQQAAQQGIVPPDTVQKIGQLQQQYFANNRAEMEQARADLLRTLAIKKQQQAAMQSGQQRPPSSGPVNMPAMGVQNGGQAPPAQMVPPAAPVQQGGQQGLQAPNQGQRPPGSLQPPQMPTIEEVHRLRASQQNAFKGTDDEMRAMLFEVRKKQYATQMQQVQAEGLRSAQTGGRPGQALQGSQTRPRPTSQPNMNTPQPGQKRAAQPQPQSASSDDVMEIPNPNAPQQLAQQPSQIGAPHAPPMQANNSRQQHVPPIPPGLPAQFHQQWPAMNNESRRALMTKIAQVSNARRTQAMNAGQQGPPQQQPQQEGTPQQAASGQQSQNQQWQVQTSALYAQVERENPKGSAVQVPDLNSPPGQHYLAAWKRLWAGIMRVQATWPPVLAQYPHLEPFVKMMMKIKVQMLQNVTDPNATVNEYFSIGPQQVVAYVQLMQRYTVELKKAKGGTDATGAGSTNEQSKGEPQQVSDQQAKQRPTPTPSAKGQQGAQAAAAAGQIGRTPSRSGHNRKASSSKVPAAPTENKTFDWGVTSPHGVPKYDSGRKEITPDNLRMPVSKKRKVTGSAASTPGAQAVTPVPTSQSPSMMAKLSPEVPGKKSSQQVKFEADAAAREEQARKTFKCTDALCEASIKGFATEAELQKHNEAEHQPVDDPLGYLLESAAGYLGNEGEGAAMQARPQSQSKSMPAGVTRNAPAVKPEATSSPASASKSMDTRSIPTSAPIDGSEPREKTLRDAVEEKMGFEPFIIPNDGAAQDFSMSATTAGAEQDKSFNDIIAASLGDLSDVDLGLNTSDSSAWNLRPGELDPATDTELTPSDGTSSQSSRESDVSRSELLRINLEWDSFGDFDTQIPEGLGIYGQLESLGGLGLDGTPEVSKDVGMSGMGDDDNKKKDGADEWNWSGDLADASWDAMFGPNAGLEEAGLVF